MADDDDGLVAQDEEALGDAGRRPATGAEHERASRLAGSRRAPPRISGRLHGVQPAADRGEAAGPAGTSTVRSGREPSGGESSAVV